MSYEYLEKHIAPKSVEFQAKTLTGHRTIRIYLDHPTPRVYAFNESPSGRSPALLYLDEVHDLIARSCLICSVPNPLEKGNVDEAP